MSFSETLHGVTACPGVRATAIADRDGIPVQSWGDESQVEEAVAEFSAFLREVASVNRELKLGDLEQLVVMGEEGTVLVTAIAEEYFLISVVDRDGNQGKARFASRVAASRLRSEFI